MTYFDSKDRTAAAEFDTIQKTTKAANNRREFDALTDAIHTEIDRLDKALGTLLDRIEPALQPKVPVDVLTEEGKASQPRSPIVRGLDGIGKHIHSVRNRLERATDRVDL